MPEPKPFSQPPEGCEHDWRIWPETDGQEQRCWKCGAYRRTPKAALEAANLLSAAPAGVPAPASTHLGNLLARIHRDGGHYIEQHGLEKAVQDADDQIVKWLGRDDDAGWQDISTAPKDGTLPPASDEPEALFYADQLHAYAAEMVQQERERCAQVCDEIEKSADDCWRATADPHDQGRSTGACECAAAIRKGGV